LFFAFAGCFIFWGDISLLEVPSWAKAGLLIGVFALYFWIADWAIFRFALPRLRQAGFSGKAQMLIFSGAILAGLTFVLAFPILPLIRARQSLEIIATGDKNPKAQSSEIFLKQLSYLDGSQIDLREFTKYGKGKWEIVEGHLVASKFPARIKWETPLSEPIKLVFFSNPGSGVVNVNWNGVDLYVDLYSPSNRMKEITLAPRIPSLYKQFFWLTGGLLVGLCFFTLAAVFLTLWINKKWEGFQGLAYSQRFIRNRYLGTLLALLIAWMLLASMNNFFRKQPFQFDLSRFFPISVFTGPFLQLNGLIYISTFVVVFILALEFCSSLRPYQLWFMAFLLIFFGNLGQGSLYSAFLRVFVETGTEYYNDAVKITSWVDWLSAYNMNQVDLPLRTKTHPPFVVLLHYLILQLGRGNVVFLAVCFMLLSSLAIVVIWYVFKALGIPPRKRNMLTLLFAVIPAINIYLVMSLEGIVLTASALFLLGLVLLLKQERISVLAIVCLVTGFILANLLNYMGVFLLAAGGLVGLYNFIFKKDPKVLVAMGVTAFSFILLTYILYRQFDYNHLQGILTTSHLENPKGFRLLAEPLSYLMTRIEDVSEIALFLSFPCLVILFHKDLLKASILDYRDESLRIVIAAVVVLLLIFLTGAFRTGETARGLLFVYPFLILAFIYVESSTLTILLVLVGIQTALMQLLGNYYW
jgi:hypothetical protein